MSTTYKIKPGDNLSTIAQKYGTTVSALQKANGISNPNLIYAGKNLTIPTNSNVSLAAEETVTEGSASTAEGFQYTPFDYDDYTESDEVGDLKELKDSAESAVTNHPDFTWDKQSDYDTLIQGYENRPDFSYDFNADALYQQYKDKYIQQGKMAMADTIGQAAALTGGYGNSYAVSAGSQAYQANLERLNDVIPELYSLAYDKYRQEGQDMLNMISLLGNERDFAYGKWGDEYNRLVADRGYYGSQYDNERAFDYGKYSDDRNLAYSDHNTEQSYGYNNYRDGIADSQWQASFDENKRQWQSEFDEAVRQYNEKMAWEKKLYEDEQTLLGSGGGSGSGGETPPKTPTEPEDDPYDKKETYADWDALDWEGYFATIRQKEGRSAAEKELNNFTSKGLIPTKYVGAAAIGARGSGGGH